MNPASFERLKDVIATRVGLVLLEQDPNVSVRMAADLADRLERSQQKFLARHKSHPLMNAEEMLAGDASRNLVTNAFSKAAKTAKAALKADYKKIDSLYDYTATVLLARAERIMEVTEERRNELAEEKRPIPENTKGRILPIVKAMGRIYLETDPERRLSMATTFKARLDKLTNRFQQNMSYLEAGQEAVKEMDRGPARTALEKGLETSEDMLRNRVGFVLTAATAYDANKLVIAATQQLLNAQNDVSHGLNKGQS